MNVQLFVAAMLAAGLAACQPAPGPGDSEANANGAGTQATETELASETPAVAAAPATETELASETPAVAAAPATEAGLASETPSAAEAPLNEQGRANRANCPVLKNQIWNASYSAGIKQLTVTGSVDLPTPAQNVTLVLDPNEAAGTAEARITLSVTPPIEGAYTAGYPATAFFFWNVKHETYTRAIIVCGDQILASIPVKRL